MAARRVSWCALCDKLKKPDFRPVFKFIVSINPRLCRGIFIAHGDSPSSKIPDGIFFRTCPRGTRLSCSPVRLALKLIHRSGLLVPTQAKKFVCSLAEMQRGARLPIVFLTKNACSPASRFLPCPPWNFMRANKNIAPAFSSLRRQRSLPALCLNI